MHFRHAQSGWPNVDGGLLAYGQIVVILAIRICQIRKGGGLFSDNKWEKCYSDAILRVRWMIYDKETVSPEFGYLNCIPALPHSST